METQVSMLRDQAKAFRDLARERREERAIHDLLLKLAQQCETLAHSIRETDRGEAARTVSSH